MGSERTMTKTQVTWISWLDILLLSDLCFFWSKRSLFNFLCKDMSYRFRIMDDNMLGKMHISPFFTFESLHQCH